MRERWSVMAAALWWGSLSTVGFIVVPMLFAHLPTPALAGQAVAKLFEAQTWVSVLCCMALLGISHRRDEGAPPAWAAQVLPWLVAGLLLALLVQFGVAPRIVMRENLRLWHTAGSVMYGLQWLCALVTLWRLSRR